MFSLRIAEIYRSIQGESIFAGWPCVFIRLAGCDLRCVYCDEPHALSGGERLELAQVLDRIRPWSIPMVELTGGEPLLQPALPVLIERLLAEGYRVLLETGGHRDISGLDPRVHVILDVKTPGSGMHEHADLENLVRLREGSEVKFVLCDRRDYEWARELVRARGLEARFHVAFSPAHGVLDPRELVKWMLDDDLHVRLNLQLHKYVWGSDVRGV
ncbi:MAG: radical SAM protein [Myxococcota bacterium]